jgi:predicted esterase
MPSFTSGKRDTMVHLPLQELEPGGYKFTWRWSDGSGGTVPLTVLPELDITVERIKLMSMQGKIREGDYHTYLFQLDNLEVDLNQLKPYETAGGIRERINRFKADLDAEMEGKLVLSGKTGTFRRAFLSRIDSTLQPYTVNIPVDFDRTKKYPLFVMLHGSGTDDRDALNFNPGNTNFIEMAPFGRGTSNCFTTDFAEVDVREAIEDVIRNYPIDTSRIVIAGFSMGGYGAYRIFYEYPKLFKGVVVFSGHPNLANKWLGSDFPDFLEEQNLASFQGVPLYIYHSRDDLNCPYDLTEQLVAKLKSAGADVEFVTATASGHGIIESSYLEGYYDWLQRKIGAELHH